MGLWTLKICRTSDKYVMSFPIKNEEWSQLLRTLKYLGDYIFYLAHSAFSGVAKTSYSPDTNATGTILILLRS
jgi:hypothetical protein